VAHDSAHARFLKTKRGERHMIAVESRIALLDQRIAGLKEQSFFKTKVAFVTFSEEASYVACLRAGGLLRTSTRPT